MSGQHKLPVSQVWDECEYTSPGAGKLAEHWWSAKVELTTAKSEMASAISSGQILQLGADVNLPDCVTDLLTHGPKKGGKKRHMVALSLASFFRDSGRTAGETLAQLESWTKAHFQDQKRLSERLADANSTVLSVYRLDEGCFRCAYARSCGTSTDKVSCPGERRCQWLQRQERSFMDIHEWDRSYQKLIKVTDDGPVYRQISNFVLAPKAIVASGSNEEDQILVDVLVDGKLERGGQLLGKSAFGSSRELKKNLLSARTVFTGADVDAQKILGVIGEHNPPVVKGVAKLGRCDDVVVIGADSCLLSSGVVRGSAAPAVYVGGDHELARRVRLDSEECHGAQATVKLVAENIHKVNRTSIGLLTVAWVCALPFKPQIHASPDFAGFPLALKWGSFGSGKTSHVESILLPLAGVEGPMQNIFTTRFSRLRRLSATTTLPVAFDEYRTWGGHSRDGELDQIAHELRNAYTASMDTRGRADQSLREYSLTSPVVLVGEAVPPDPALRERFVIGHLRKRDIEAKAEGEADDAKTAAKVRREAFQRLAGAQLFPFAYLYNRWALQQDFSALRSASNKEFGGKIRSSLPNRVLSNMSVLALGNYCFSAFLTSMGLKSPFDGKDFDSLVDEQLKEILGEVEGKPGGRVRNALDEMLDTMAVMVGMGDLRKVIDYDVVDGLIRLHFGQVYPKFRGWVQRNSMDTEVASKGAYVELAKELLRQKESYVVGWNMSARIGGVSRKSLIVEVAKAQMLDLAGFLEDEPGF